jgi:hypothetical protein
MWGIPTYLIYPFFVELTREIRLVNAGASFPYRKGTPFAVTRIIVLR